MSNIAFKAGLNDFQQTMKTNIISINRSTKSSLKYTGNRIKSSFNKLRPEFKYLLLAVPIVATFFLVKEFRERQSLRVGAEIHNAGLSFQLQNWSLPPEHTFGLWINSNFGVAFADVTVTFDPTKVFLTREVSPTGSLARVVQLTPMSEANSTGRVQIVLALDPSQRLEAPSQAFQIANLSFNANTTLNGTATIGFLPQPMQLVATDQTLFSTTVQSLAIVVNPTPTPAATPTPFGASPTPSDSSNPGSTQPPITNDTTPPTITITSPIDGSTVPSNGNLQIRSTAQDSAGIYRVTIAIDGTVSKTCNGSTSCQYNLNVNRITTGSHTITVTAIDNSSNRNSSSRTITVTKN